MRRKIKRISVKDLLLSATEPEQNTGLHLVAELCFLPVPDSHRGQENAVRALVTSPCLVSVSALGFRCAPEAGSSQV